MNTDHLTDKELIDYTLKFDTDPVRIRLAQVMDNMPGFILQRLEDVGMDPETCMFENNYDPGDWISHLEGEIDYLSRELQEAHEALRKLEVRSVLDFMEEANSMIQNLDRQLRQSNDEKSRAVKDRDYAQEQLKVWNHLRTP